MASKKFSDLGAWQRGHRLALFVYRITKEFPGDGQFALTSQLRGAAVSVPSNVAEMFHRFFGKEKAYFYSVALGSAPEANS
jgi:four helix bundle protein